MRFLIAFAFAGCLVTGAASAQVRPASPARTQSIPQPSANQNTDVLQRAADQKWNAVFAADRAFTQAVREAVAAEIAARRVRGENVAQLDSELSRLNNDTQMSFNLQYLQLQSQMQHENRSYTAISSIMRTKHETVRNTISNIR